MKSIFALIVIITFVCYPLIGVSRNIDTLIDVGGYRLHFNIIKGKGIPILFETGGGDDASVWNNILKPIYDSTGATLITYDRAGFGKSELDTNKTNILQGIEGLETGLAKLGYTGNLMLVCHSLGGYYGTLYASRHPEEVKAAILIDANLSCYFTKETVKKFLSPFYSDMNKFKKENLAVYYTLLNFERTNELMRKIVFPPTIPVIDMVAENPPFEDINEVKRWKDCHQQFVNASSERRLIDAKGSEHYIYKDNPQLVIDALVRMYKTLNSQ